MIPLFKVRMSAQVLEYLDEVLMSGMIGEGPKVVEFTRQLNKLFSNDLIVPLNSGTSALIMALRLAGVEGGEVITTPFTMIATNVAIKAERGEVVFADIEEQSVNVSIPSIKEKITSRTKAIVVTHVAGIPCRMEELQDVEIPIIGDAAHAIGTCYQGEHISYWSDYTCFSFQSIKQLTTGDGGALVLQNGTRYQQAEKLKWFGMTREVPPGLTRLQHQMTADVEDWGYKFHMNDISASIGLANLIRLDSALRINKLNAQYLRVALQDIPGLTLVELPEGSDPSWFAFPMFVEKRDDFIRMMTENGIETTPMWRRNDEYTVFCKDKINYLPNMTRRQHQIIFIPVGWWITPQDLDYIIETIKGGW